LLGGVRKEGAKLRFLPPTSNKFPNQYLSYRINHSLFTGVGVLEGRSEAPLPSTTVFMI
jgi:hypothetical protein